MNFQWHSTLLENEKNHDFIIFQCHPLLLPIKFFIEGLSCLLWSIIIIPYSLICFIKTDNKFDKRIIFKPRISKE